MRALETGDRDLEKVFDVVDKVSRRAHLIKNLRAYATRALFRVKKRPQIEREPLTDIEYSVSVMSGSPVETIEAQILVRELLEVMEATDREIFIRLMNGETCPEIDTSMNLKPRTAEIRLRVCKNALRRAVEKKLKP